MEGSPEHFLESSSISGPMDAESAEKAHEQAMLFSRGKTPGRQSLAQPQSKIKPILSFQVVLGLNLVASTSQEVAINMHRTMRLSKLVAECNNVMLWGFGSVMQQDE